ncbi:MAG: ADP-ribosylglycohydrolase family protein [Ignavibacteriae bacterium]|nr:ADP-ribosylglycohydrolase family protein [Ignavibacteriota bacterium]
MEKYSDINTPLFGAITGDIIGSIFEWKNVKSTEFDLFCDKSDFTDDTVMSIAVADCLLNGKDYTKTYQDYGRKYPHRCYGGFFKKWIYMENPKPYNSWGNGSAMRVSACGSLYDYLVDSLEAAKNSAMPTHNHPEGIKGAQATASAIYLARQGSSKAEIKNYIENTFYYDLNRKIDDIRKIYNYDVSCKGSVPESIIAFLESSDYESAIRLAISIGGDSDTIACITGGIALAYYKELPFEIGNKVWNILPGEFKEIITQFNSL